MQPKLICPEKLLEPQILRLFLTMRFAHPPELTGLLSQRHSAPLEDFQQILIKESYWKSEKNENLVGCKLNPPPRVP